jgi:hypothetical protein
MATEEQPVDIRDAACVRIDADEGALPVGLL